MAANQGLKRLLRGAEKTITNSEANRGYFFVTNDHLAINKLGQFFDVKFIDHMLKDRHIDSYGRISVGRVILKEYKDKALLMKIEGKHLTIKIVKS